MLNFFHTVGYGCVVGSISGPLAAGLMLGLLGVGAWNRAFALVAQPSASPWLPLSVVVVALAATVTAGCAAPTWRAVRASPADALRRE